MKIAVFETSTEWCGAALWLDGEVRALEQRAGNRHGELVLPMLERLLARAGLAPKHLDAVAFGAGPGAFTGIRIACGVAQGLALARGLPVLGVSTLEAIAEESGAARAMACLDARMREVYYAAFEKDVRGWREVVGPQCVAAQAVKKPDGREWLGCGSGFSIFPDLLRSEIPVKPEIHPSAVAVARLAAPRLARGEGVDASLAAPVYVRDKVAYTKAELEAR